VPRLTITYSARREGKFSERLQLTFGAGGPEAGGGGAPGLELRVEGSVMGREDGKPLPRQGVRCIREARPEDLDTEAGTTWEGFGQRRGS